MNAKRQLLFALDVTSEKPAVIAFGTTPRALVKGLAVYLREGDLKQSVATAIIEKIQLAAGEQQVVFIPHKPNSESGMEFVLQVGVNPDPNYF